MDLRHLAQRLAYNGAKTVVFTAAAILLLSGCNYDAMNEMVKGRTSPPTPSAYQAFDKLDLMVASGNYRQIGGAWAQLSPASVGGFLTASEAAAIQRFDGDALSKTNAGAVATSMALAGQISDSTGTASEISGLANAFQSSPVKLWSATEMGYGPETGASGFGFTDGSRAYLAKAIGSPLARHLPLHQRQDVTQAQVRIYHPSAGLSFMIASWPLAGHPVAGLNKHGLAMTVTSFDAGSPKVHNDMPFAYRRVLQSASSVEQALRRLYSVSDRDTGAVVMVADRFGAMAHLECGVTRCVELAVTTNSPLQAAHGAHATTGVGGSATGSPTAGSVARLENLEQAIKQADGRLNSAQSALDVLRSVAPSNALHGDVVANSQLSGVVILDPYNQTLWHSTGSSPTAAFSGMVEIGFDGPTGNTLDAASLNPQVTAAYQLLSQAEQAHVGGDHAGAQQALDSMPAVAALDRQRLSYFRALVLAGLGQYQESADAALAAASQNNQVNLAVHAHLLRAWNFERLGNSAQTLRMFELADQVATQGPVDNTIRNMVNAQRLPNSLDSFPTLLAL